MGIDFLALALVLGPWVVLIVGSVMFSVSFPGVYLGIILLSTHSIKSRFRTFKAAFDSYFTIIYV